MPKIKDISGLTPDPANANRGTERGHRVLSESLEQYGAGRSILTDKHGTVIAGNKTLEAAAEMGLPIQVVESDGHTLVVVQRTDLELDGPDGERARMLAYADNRSAELDLDWNADQILEDMMAGFDLSGFWSSGELDTLRDEAETPGFHDRRAAGSEGDEEPPAVYVKAVFAVEDVEVVESALFKANPLNRGDALVAVCRAFLAG